MTFYKRLSSFRLLSISLLVIFVLAGCSTDSEPKSEKVWSGDEYERSYSPSIGPDNAKVTIVEYLDPACSACRAFYPFVKEILSRHPNDVRLVVRYAAFHEGTAEVVKLLEIARQQNKLLPVLEALLKDQQKWVANHKANIGLAWKVVEESGLDIAAAKAQMDSPELESILQQEGEDVRKLQIRQTPTFFVNKKPLEEFGAQQLYDLVISEIQANAT